MAKETQQYTNSAKKTQPLPGRVLKQERKECESYVSISKVSLFMGKGKGGGGETFPSSSPPPPPQQAHGGRGRGRGGEKPSLFLPHSKQAHGLREI